MFFGTSPFAQVSYASLAQNIYPLSVTENVGSGDSETIAAGFAATTTENFGPLDSSTQTTIYQGILVTEAVTANDTNAEIDVFYFGIVEGIIQADSNQAGLVYTYSVPENIGMAGTPTGGFISFNVVTENMGVSTSFPTQTNYGVPVTEATTVLDTEVFHAQFLLATVEATTMADTPNQSSWTKINDSQSAAWTRINNTQ